MYIGWAGDTQEVCQENKEVINSWESDGYIAVDIPTDVLTSAHENFNNQVLWALFHNFPNYMNYRDSDWNCYVQFNEIFAKRVIELYKEGDIIWIQDFQLMLLPKMLRKLCQRQI